ncbi:MAG TPA: capsule assembly Wzi family protein [Acidobacteriaceae bacterium]|nr:capsule assembly Wzi family protein [Acidobacteriaceae bacterium]
MIDRTISGFSATSRKLLRGLRSRTGYIAAVLCLGSVLFPFGTAGAATQCATGPGGARPADVYVPVDSWVYTALDRLHGLGYLDTAFLGLKPWTRRSIQHMLDEIDTEGNISQDVTALELLTGLQREFGIEDGDLDRLSYACEGAYTRLQGIGGQTLRDSFHLGQTIAYDYGRPYQPGFNTVDGASGSAEFGRFSLYARAEYQHAPAAAGYSPALATTLSNIDLIPVATNPVQATIPQGPIPATNAFRIVEANVSYRLLNHQISFGKSDHWLAPDKGGSFLYSNNAENIYAFQIDRVEPLHVPLLSWLTGPFRYDFFVGSLKGHSDPNDPWIHTEKINFKPTPNVELGFSRSTIWGGKGHAPITLRTFLKSFFSFQNVSGEEKLSRSDPGARFGTFDFSWRLPFLSHWMTLYSDSLVHDDVSPIDAPRHAGVRPGIYLSHLPKFEKLDFRIEGVNTDPPVRRSNAGAYLYTEYIQAQGYTNKGYIMGDAIGREGKGGQAWLTYHLSPAEMVQLSFRHAKAAKDFVPLGTTQNSFDVHVVKRLRDQFELSADVQQEWWKAPVYQAGRQNDTVVTFQITALPHLRSSSRP